MKKLRNEKIVLFAWLWTSMFSLGLWNEVSTYGFSGTNVNQLQSVILTMAFIIFTLNITINKNLLVKLLINWDWVNVIILANPVFLFLCLYHSHDFVLGIGVWLITIISIILMVIAKRR